MEVPINLSVFSHLNSKLLVIRVLNSNSTMKTEPKIGLGMEVYFRSKVFEPTGPWYPYYEAYKGHKFQVTGVYEGDHIGLVCISDPTVVVQGHVHDDELKRA